MRSNVLCNLCIWGSNFLLGLFAMPRVIYNGFPRNSKWPYKAGSTAVKPEPALRKHAGNFLLYGHSYKRPPSFEFMTSDDMSFQTTIFSNLSPVTPSFRPKMRAHPLGITEVLTNVCQVTVAQRYMYIVAVATSSEAKALLFERVSTPRLSMKRWLQKSLSF